MRGHATAKSEIDDAARPRQFSREKERDREIRSRPTGVSASRRDAVSIAAALPRRRSGNKHRQRPADNATDFHEFFRARRFIPCKFRETADSSERSGRDLRARADLMPQTAAAVRRSRVWRVQLATGSASALFRQEKRDVRQGMREIAEGWSHLSTYSPFSTH